MAIDEQMEEGSGAAAKGKKSNLLLIILLVVTTLLLVAVSISATLYFTGAMNHEAATQAGTADAKGGEGGHGGDGEGEHAKSDPVYVELGDPLVVNFVENNQIRYLQVQMEVMTRDPAMPDKIKQHMPLIRNNLLMMLSDLDYATISSFSGKQKIRAEALAEVQNIMQEETGDPVVEELYFTSFVMQ